MKKWVGILVCMLLFTGCGQPEAFETMSDRYQIPEPSEPQNTTVWLPEGLVEQASENGQELYLGEDFSAWVQILPSGDLDATLRAVTGYSREKLELLGRETDQGHRWECAWTCAGEEGDLVARTLVVDDGSYHYTLTVQAAAEKAGQLALTWQEMFRLFRLGQEEIGKE